jgi:CHAT domain-containing protein
MRGPKCLDRLAIAFLFLAGFVQSGEADQDLAKPLPKKAVETLLKRAEKFRNQKGARAAASLGETAAQTAATLSDSVGVAEALGLEATAQQRAGEIQPAAKTWERASDAWLNANFHIFAAGARARSILLIANDAQLKKLLILISANSPLPNELAERAYDLADDLRTVGRNAESKEIVEALLPVVKPGSFELACVYEVEGELAYDEGNATLSLNVLQSAITLIEAHPQLTQVQRTRLVDCYVTMGYTFVGRFDMTRAEHCAQKTLALLGNKPRPSVDLACAFGILAETSWYSSDPATATIWGKRAVVTLKQLPASSDNLASLAALYGNLAHYATNQGDEHRAEQLLSKDRYILEKLEPNSLDLAIVYMNLASHYYRIDQLTESLFFSEKAAAIREVESPQSVDHALTLMNQGQTENRLGRWSKAVECLEHSKAIADYQLETETTLGTRRDLEIHSAHFVEPLSVAYLGEGQTEKAFEVSNDRSSIFSLELSQKGIDVLNYADPQRRATAAMLKEEVAKDRKDLVANPTRWLAERLNGDLGEINNRLKGLEEEAVKERPSLNILRAPEDFSVERAEKSLDPGTLLLQYAVDDESLVIFSLTSEPNSLHAYKVSVKKDDLAKLCRRFRDQIANQTDFRRAGSALYDLLIRPATRELKHCDRLLISPQGPLCFVPFSALVAASPGLRFADDAIDVEREIRSVLAAPDSANAGKTSFADLTYLVDQKPIHTIPSLPVYDAIRRETPGTATVPFLGFGRPNYHGTMPDLLNSQREVTEIAASLNGKAVVGDQATYANALQLAPDARWIHFACHSRLSGDEMASGLALTPTAGDPGLLQVYDIVDKLHLNADLVTLSACDTALGVNTDREGVENLARAFQIAGARTVLMSLWSVDDASTSSLMIRFYSHLKEGKTKDEALQMAEREIRGQWSHPYYWAPFTLSGDYR